MDFQTIWDLIVANGLPALVIAVVVFFSVWIADRVGLLNSGTAKRIGVFVGAYLLSGYEPGDIDAGITLVLGSILAAVVREFKDFIAERATQ